MAAEFQRENLLRLPLPLAQLYARANNAKDARSRHDHTFYLFEALVKLAAAPGIAAYVREARAGGPRTPALDRALLPLALPSLGHWVAMLRECARYYSNRADAATHPLGHVGEQLTQKRRDWPAVLALYRRIKNGPDNEPAGAESCSLQELIDALVQYRNAVFGHGGPRAAAFYENEVGPLLFPAVNEVLAEGRFDFLGPRGTRLVYLAEMRTLEGEEVELGLRDLVGLQGERSAPLRLSGAAAKGLAPQRVVLLWPGQAQPLRLDPLVAFREGEIADELLFLNRERNARHVEYLSYTTGRTERDATMATALAELLGVVSGRTIGTADLGKMAEQTLSETPSLEAILGPESPAATTLGDYELLGELGRGGMGVVYLARQLSLGRLVALKMLPADLAGDEVALARFRREIRLLARCDHPHIVKVIASGVFPNGHPYYAMEYVPGCNLEFVWREVAKAEGAHGSSSLDGTSFARAVLSAALKQRGTLKPASGYRLRAEDTDAGTGDRTESQRKAAPVEGIELPLPPLPAPAVLPNDPGGYTRRVALLVRDAASAVQAIHDQELVHRDIKPANLMLSPDGSRVVLMDFGLAKSAATRAELTQQGGFLGTLRYAAPEQLAAAKLRVGPAADVRALGVTLWELLTRQRAFGDAQDEAELARRVHDDDLPALRTIDPHCNRDLEAIVARATERRVGDRIATAGELAQYLQLFLDGKPIPIRTPSSGELLWRWIGEHKGLVGTSVATLVTVLTTLTVALVLISRSAQTANEALSDRAGAMVTLLKGAPAEAVPSVIERMEPDRDKFMKMLQWDWAFSEKSPSERVRVGLMLLPSDESVAPYLYEQMLVAPPADAVMIRNALVSRREAYVAPLWEIATATATPVEKRLRAAAALATFDPQNGRWKELAPATAAAILAGNTFEWGVWTEAFRPVSDALLPALVAEFCVPLKNENRYGAAVLCAAFTANRPQVLADLAAEADARQFAVLLPRLNEHAAAVIPHLEAELSRKCEPEWDDLPLAARLGELSPAAAKKINSAQGTVAERFAFCVTLPPIEFTSVNQALVSAGYRLARLRPHASPSGLQVAATWLRDQLAAEHSLGATAEEIEKRDAELRAKGLLPIDVCGYVVEEGEPKKASERFAAVWCAAPEENVKRELVVGSSEEPDFGHTRYLTLQQYLGATGRQRYCTLGWTAPPISFALWNRGPVRYASVLRGASLNVQQDVCVSPVNSGDAILRATTALVESVGEKDFTHQYAAVFNDVRDEASTELHGLTPEEHCKKAQELAQQGWRPNSISVYAPREKPALVASVWKMPLITDERLEALAARQANAAATLLLLGHPEKAWPLFQHSSEPRPRSWLIHALGAHGVSPETLLARIEQEPEVSAQRALYLAVGELSEKLNEPTREKLATHLETIYREHADAGLHAAAEWVLRRLGQDARLAEIDRELAQAAPAENRSWYVNGQGQTLVVFRGPVEFFQGSPKGETDQDTAAETPLKMRIPRSFAVATKEVSVEQIQPFFEAYPNTRFFYSPKYTPTHQCPMTSVSWFVAAQYCRWLSEQERIPEDQMCYPPVKEIKDGMRLPANYLQRTGYRLPTEAEWEYACRAGAHTSRAYGGAEELLGNYAYYVRNSNDRTWPVGRLKPNDFGLFDMHGNMWEWCHEAAATELPPIVPEVMEDREEPNLKVTAGQFRMVRGGSFDRNASHVRSAARLRLRTTDDYLIVGLRVARTLPDAKP